LREVRRPQHVGDVVDGGAHERGQRFRRDLQERAAERGDVDETAGPEVEAAVLGGGVVAQGQHVGVGEGHRQDDTEPLVSAVMTGVTECPCTPAPRHLILPASGARWTRPARTEADCGT
jgi:hypothetical protein